jgi:hypothetical protein
MVSPRWRRLGVGVVRIDIRVGKSRRSSSSSPRVGLNVGDAKSMSMILRFVGGRKFSSKVGLMTGLARRRATDVRMLGGANHVCKIMLKITNAILNALQGS